MFLQNIIKINAMEDNAKLIESLLDKATEYGKTSFELVKLKAVDKASDAVSSFVPYTISIIFIASFMLFLNLGLALWFGEILGRVYYGFLLVAAFYGVIGIFIHLVMHKWIKRRICNSLIKQMLK
jgi:fatty acid desaturase